LRTAKTAERERRSRWSFSTGDDGLWLWRVTPPEGRETSSKQSFPTLTECILDAKQHGYVLWTSRDRRTTS
jgi:hypothetical protein